MKPIFSQKILKVKNSQIQSLEDFVAVETKIKITINNKKIFSLSATPIQIKELAIGFLLTENIIKNKWHPEKIDIIEKNGEIEIKIETENILNPNKNINELSEKYKNDFKIELKNLFSLFKKFQRKSELYKITGCIHYAGLADLDKIIFLGEDVGRHNAVDKVIGFAFLNKISLKNKVLLLSGRISSKMVLKAEKVKIPIIVSRGAPTSLAIEIAEKADITIVGFLRNKRCNIYTHAEKIIF